MWLKVHADGLRHTHRAYERIGRRFLETSLDWCSWAAALGPPPPRRGRLSHKREGDFRQMDYLGGNRAEQQTLKAAKPASSHNDLSYALLPRDLCDGLSDLPRAD